jgi:hypothetical protein
MLSTWTIEDNQDVLLGPEIKIVRVEEMDHSYAIVYRDIFD